MYLGEEQEWHFHFDWTYLNIRRNIILTVQMHCSLVKWSKNPNRSEGLDSYLHGKRREWRKYETDNNSVKKIGSRTTYGVITTKSEHNGNPSFPKEIKTLKGQLLKCEDVERTKRIVTQ